MTRLLLLSAILVMAGCGKPMTNKEIIEESKYCQDSGMRAIRRTNFGGDTMRIECWPHQTSE